MKFSNPSVILLSAVAIAACAAQSDQVKPTITETKAMTETNTPAVTAKHFSAAGTVRFQQINGGFWGIVADDGTRYDPMELDPQFQKDGLRVRFEAVPETEMMSTRMWGTMITLIDIETVKPD